MVFKLKENAKMIKDMYLAIDAPSSYNMINRQPIFNLSGVSLSTLYLSMKYPLSKMRIGVIQGDQETARKCYQGSFRIGRATM